jgi:hypothetical protein
MDIIGGCYGIIGDVGCEERHGAYIGECCRTIWAREEWRFDHECDGVSFSLLLSIETDFLSSHVKIDGWKESIRKMADIE